MFLEKLHQIKAFVLDIDGVLTDATVHVTETGEQLRRFNVRDGYAIQLALKRGFKICAISGGKSQGALLRLNTLGMADVYLGIAKKIDTYNKFVEDHGLSPEEILYMGDDIPDLPVMKLAGVPVCPADAVEEVKEISVYISPKGGGHGCVRDVIEKVLKVQDKWFDPNPVAGDSTIVSS
ncbi:MAG: 3-deoxy-D-manno-octulosonate 8-phosphate phosphatase, YrbI family [Sphingobacteriaceae bacterium]|jgi:3-deoxy-D-manno-octulosonate 8-phosphate phosphatase (KDO 8-P phosphatase)|nr:3-deoxy-D-manno-octulosonate 8-phosphate phosphatase, YrbI family [Sphingobacteriaceae bacterium]